MRHILQIGLIILLTIIIYSNSFKIPFIWDDEVQILGNQFVREKGFLTEIFTTSVMSGGSGPGGVSFYRPLVILFYRLEYIFFGPNPWGFHLISLLFHLLNIILVYQLVRKIIEKHFPGLSARAPAFISSFLFALHPVNVETVSWIASQGDLIATAAIFGAFLFLLRWAKNFSHWGYLIAAQFLFCFALFTKEPIIVFPLIALVYFFLFYPIKKNISVFLKFAFSSAIPIFIYILFRFLIAKVYFGSPLSLINRASFFERVLTSITTLASYFKLIIFPSPLFSDRQFVITKLSDYRFIISFLFLAFLIFLFLKFYRKISPVIPFFGVWFFIGIFPTFNLLFPGGPTMAERYLYFPIIGIIFLIALGIVYLFQKFPKIPKVILILFLFVNFGFWSQKVWARNELWQEPLRFYQHDLKLSPESFLLQNNFGVEYFRQGNIDEAEESFLRAIEIEPKYGVAYNNLGAVFERKGKVREAISKYEKSIELSNYFLAYINLGDIYLREGRYNEANLLLEKAADSFPYNSAVLSRLNLIKSIQQENQR